MSLTHNVHRLERAVSLATGATAKLLPGTQKSDNVLTYQEMILAEQLPSSIIIGGSGAIGTEFAYVLNSYGVDVTIVEYLDRETAQIDLLIAEQERLSQEAQRRTEELRDEKAALFATYLPRGTYEYTYSIRASLPGEFRVIPTHAAQMYFPEVFGRGDGGLFRITE